MPCFREQMRSLAAALDDFRQKLLDPELKQAIQPVPGFPVTEPRPVDRSHSSGG